MAVETSAIVICASGLVKSAVACIAGSAAGNVYGEKLRSGDVGDHFGIKGRVAPAVYDAFDRGFLDVYSAKTCPFAVIGPSTRFAGFGSPVTDTFGYDVSDDQNGNLIVPPLHLPAFLAHNGIQIMTVGKLLDQIKFSLSATMSLSDAMVKDEFRFSGSSGAICTSPTSAIPGLRPGEATLWLKLNQEFGEYQKDPAAFKDNLKSEIVQAMGVDVRQCSNIKQHIKILDAKPGSIEVTILMGACAIIAFTFVAAFKSGRKFVVRAPGGQGEVELGEVSYINHPDGSYEVRGQRRETQSCSAM